MQTSPAAVQRGPVSETEAAPQHPSAASLPAPSATPPQGEPAFIHRGSATLSAVQSLSFIIVIAIFTVTFSLQPFRIPSASMEPTLLVGDFLLVDKREPISHNWLSPFPNGAIHRGDVIVFYYPVDPSLHLVKRVIGLPGDRLRMRSGRVFINGKPLDEPYAVYSRAREDSFRDNFPHLQSTDPDVDSRWWMEMQHLVDHGELKIPPDRYFVLGDNRNDSEDSRYWGLVPSAAVVGEPFLVYFSLQEPSGDLQAMRGNTFADPARKAGHRSLGEAVTDVARWDRVMHVVR